MWSVLRHFWLRVTGSDASAASLTIGCGRLQPTLEDAHRAGAGRPSVSQPFEARRGATPDAVGCGGRQPPPPPRPSQPVEGAPHAEAAPIQHVEIGHRRRHGRMTEELLDGSDVMTALQQMGRERVPERILTLLMNHPPPSFTTGTILFTAEMWGP
jgi:hypothetical protein